MNVKKLMTVPERLTELGDLYKERNALYGDNYKRFGETLVSLFPQGITLTSAEDFNRFALFVQIIHKMSRYARSVNDGGHEDSVNDATVYLQMLGEYDDVLRTVRESQSNIFSNTTTIPLTT